MLASFYCEYNYADKPFLVNKKHYLGIYLICNEEMHLLICVDINIR